MNENKSEKEPVKILDILVVAGLLFVAAVGLTYFNGQEQLKISNTEKQHLEQTNKDLENQLKGMLMNK